jgi:hypothetical protein
MLLWKTTPYFTYERIINMKLFNKLKTYTIVIDKDAGRKAWLFAYRHCAGKTEACVRAADELHAITFTTGLERAEMVKKLRGVFVDTHNVRVTNNVVLITRKG